MEHRLHRREPVDFMVRLLEGENVVATVRAFDMSAGGMGLESPVKTLRAGQWVKIDFSKPGSTPVSSCCLNTMVVHADNKKMGLMYIGETFIGADL